MRGVLILTEDTVREHPLGSAVPPALLPLYDQPALFYPLASLLQAAIDRITIAGPASTLASLEKLLGDGSDYGLLQLHYEKLSRPGRLLPFLAGSSAPPHEEPVVVMLAHNFFVGPNLREQFQAQPGTARMFASQGQTAEHYGVLEFEEAGAARPHRWRVPDLGVFPEDLAKKAKSLKTSGDASLDLEKLHRAYAQQERLEVVRWGPEMSWYDLTHYESYWSVGRQMEEWELRTGRKVACLEEIALLTGMMHQDRCLSLCERYPDGPHRRYLRRILEECGLLPPQSGSLRLIKPTTSGS